MPSALLKPCGVIGGGCPELVESGCCLAHAKAREARRGSAASRGYGSRWVQFRAWFIAKLIAFGIAPVCGARWPAAPVTHDSRCQAAGRMNNRHLHLDHTPPLTEAERSHEAAVCDPMRVQLLCVTCHNAKTQREQQQQGTIA